VSVNGFVNNFKNYDFFLLDYFDKFFLKSLINCI
jgi:hypothetical protein